jgi:hypothetical protein
MKNRLDDTQHTATAQSLSEPGAQSCNDLSHVGNADENGSLMAG